MVEGKYDGYMRRLEGAEKRKCWHLRTALGALCDHFEIPSGALVAYRVTLEALWDHYEVTLGSVWGQFGYLWVTLGQLTVILQ